jgi:hypothetical protein
MQVRMPVGARAVRLQAGDDADREIQRADIAAVRVRAATRAISPSRGRRYRQYASRPGGIPGIATFALWVAALGAPIFAIAKACVFASIVWALTALFDTPLRMRPVISLFVYGELICTLAGPYLVGILYARGLSSIAAPGDLIVPLGFDAFVDISGSPVLAAIARSTTIFDVLWFVLIAIGLSRVASMSRLAAASTALTIWTVTIITGVVRVLMLT